jgi:hypothetical protein
MYSQIPRLTFERVMAVIRKRSRWIRGDVRGGSCIERVVLRANKEGVVVGGCREVVSFCVETVIGRGGEGVAVVRHRVLLYL